MRILLIDNFDSFTYNLYQQVASLGHEIIVKRNNEITLNEIKTELFDAVIISPGPGNPLNEKDFGVCKRVILELKKTPILGVCLGHQGIIGHLGGKIIHAPKPMHGKTSLVTHTNHPLFERVSNPFEVMRYHSLVGDRKTLPDALEIIAESLDDKQIMAIAHKTRPLYGVQFHPESIGTKEGVKVVENFLKMANPTSN